MAKLVWRVKLVAELGSGTICETEVAAIERDDFATSDTLGLTLGEGKWLTAAVQAEIVRAQVAEVGAVPMVRALWDEAPKQGLLPRHIPVAVR